MCYDFYMGPNQTDKIPNPVQNPRSEETLSTEEKFTTTRVSLIETMEGTDDPSHHSTLYNLCYRVLPELESVEEGTIEDAYLDMYYGKGSAQVKPPGSEGEAKRMCERMKQYISKLPIEDLFGVEVVLGDKDDKLQSPYRLKFTKKKTGIEEQEAEQQEKVEGKSVLSEYFSERVLVKARRIVQMRESPDYVLEEIDLAKLRRQNNLLSDYQPISNLEIPNKEEGDALRVVFIYENFTKPLEDLIKQEVIDTIPTNTNRKRLYTKEEIEKKIYDFLTGRSENPKILSRNWPVSSKFMELHKFKNSREALIHAKELLKPRPETIESIA